VPLHPLAVEFVEAKEKHAVVDDATVSLHANFSESLSGITTQLSDTPERRGTCTVCGKAVVEAGAVTRRRVRWSALIAMF
jgi:hypothetical protein